MRALDPWILILEHYEREFEEFGEYVTAGSQGSVCDTILLHYYATDVDGWWSTVSVRVS